MTGAAHQSFEALCEDLLLAVVAGDALEVIVPSSTFSERRQRLELAPSGGLQLATRTVFTDGGGATDPQTVACEVEDALAFIAVALRQRDPSESFFQHRRVLPPSCARCAGASTALGGGPATTRVSYLAKYRWEEVAWHWQLDPSSTTLCCPECGRAARRVDEPWLASFPIEIEPRL